MGFISLTEAPSEMSDPVFWFVFQKNNLLVETDGEKNVVPKASSLTDLGFKSARSLYLGTLNGSHCFAAEPDEKGNWPENANFMDLRMLHGMMSPDFLQAAVTAIQVLNWDETFQFCGRCGTPTENKPDERAKVCPACGLMNFPRLAPAIMAAVIRDDRILLANGRGFPSNFFSVLAGFVEPGETLEECVEREVCEEVGITVQNIRYFGSQPWPFPNSLMIAFTMEHKSGEIHVDSEEINSAGWFSEDAMPFRPDARISISGRLIDWFENRNSGHC